MRYSMPQPTLINGTYYLRVRVPSDLIESAAGQVVSLPVGKGWGRCTLKDIVKLSLRTKDPAEAKLRFSIAHAALVEFWEGLRAGPIDLSHKQALALAGEVRSDFVRIPDEDPGNPEIWRKVLSDNQLAQEGRVSELQVVQPRADATAALEKRFGGLVDVVLKRHRLQVTRASRTKLLGNLSNAMNEAAQVNLAKAMGDYSDSGETKSYPAFEVPKTQAPVETNGRSVLSFGDVIEGEVKKRERGRGGAPMRASSVRKYILAAREFAEYRGSDNMLTVNAREADGWIVTMLDEGSLSVNTVAQRFQNLRTIVRWARVNSLHQALASRCSPGQKHKSQRPTFKLQKAVAALLLV